MLRLSRWFAVAAVLLMPLSAWAQGFCPAVALYAPAYSYVPSYGYGGYGYAPSYGYSGYGGYGYGGYGGYGYRGYNPGGLGGPYSGLGVRPGLGLGGFGLRR